MYLENKRWPENFNENEFHMLLAKSSKIWSTLNNKKRHCFKKSLKNKTKSGIPFLPL
jgi:hypothetical protein